MNKNVDYEIKEHHEPLKIREVLLSGVYILFKCFPQRFVVIMHNVLFTKHIFYC